MSLKLYDYTCPHCNITTEALIDTKEPEQVLCEKCKNQMIRQMPAPKEFHAIIPTYPGSKRHKAGYQHKFVNRPATKTQIGYGGGISQGEPQ